MHLLNIMCHFLMAMSRKQHSMLESAMNKTGDKSCRENRLVKTILSVLNVALEQHVQLAVFKEGNMAKQPFKRMCRLAWYARFSSFLICSLEFYYILLIDVRGKDGVPRNSFISKMNI